MPFTATKALESGNMLTMHVSIEAGNATVTVRYADYPSDADKAEADAVVQKAIEAMGMEQEENAQALNEHAR